MPFLGVGALLVGRFSFWCYRWGIWQHLLFANQVSWFAGADGSPVQSNTSVIRRLG
ncbi:hypothetical protein LYNGBM3L_47510 [Moorena producens 3L]|uniref:Uncharacterized protein n=1 Tax=Moorena producens 3L TaxID=489825 RepID=F4XXH7_9CYAN|nr:hypothetical protein LYNGBM3L_47510 [Moorena producens 3L]